MFNEEEKNQYLLSLAPQTAKVQKSYFNKICSFEEELQKDIVFFTKEEFNDMLQKIGSFSKGNSLYVFVSSLKRYSKWYNEVHEDCYIDFDSVFDSNYKDVSISYWKSVEDMLDDILHVVDEKMEKYKLSYSEKDRYKNEFRMKYNVGIGTLVLCWYGLTVEEMINLKSEGVSDTECKIYVEGREEVILIDASAMFILRQIKSANSYITFKEDTDKNGISVYSPYKVPFFSSSYFFKKSTNRSTPNEKVTRSTINNAIFKLNKNLLGKMFSIVTIKENGMFCRAYNKAKQMPELQFKHRDNNDDYYAIFDDWVKKLNQKQFQNLKYKYKAFVDAMQYEK